MAAINKRTHRQAFGVKILLSSHSAVRKLKRQFKPTHHGYKVWTSSWVLIDYLKHTRAVQNKRVLDLACGWGTAGIYCAKMQNATVTGVDIDADVQPFLTLMAKTNGVAVNFLELEFDQVRRPILKDIDVIIAADICFCDTLIHPLRRLIQRAKAAGVEQVIFADPGRWPFDDLSEYFTGRNGAEVVEWEISKPKSGYAKILHIKF